MIKSFTIKNLMSHSNISLTDIPEINVVIGKNDTGKTGLLKMLYATAKTLEVYSFKKRSGDVNFKKELADKLLNTFMPRKNGLSDLVQKGSGEKLEVHVELTGSSEDYNQLIHFSFGERTESTIVTSIDENHIRPIPPGTLNALFIPAKEVLTAFNDIASSREVWYGTGFDDTYLDLIKALRVSTSRGRVSTELSSVNKSLEDLFEGKIEQTGNQEQPFIFKKGNQLFAMQQTAEGIKKIGILTTLITNRQLGKGTMLFMDEPETALHPNAIRSLVEMLAAMSKAGVQVFIATHNYFVIKQMAISAKRDRLNVKCWSLEKKTGLPVSNSFQNLIDGVLPENSIVNESLAMYNDDIKLNLGL